MLVKYAEALGSGLGILSAGRSWGRIQAVEEKFVLDALENLPRIEDRGETDASSVWFAIRRAAFHARVVKV